MSISIDQLTLRILDLEERMSKLEGKPPKLKRLEDFDRDALPWAALLAIWPDYDDDLLWTSAADAFDLLPSDQRGKWTSVTLGRYMAKAARGKYTILFMADGERWILDTAKDTKKHQQVYRPVPLP